MSSTTGQPKVRFSTVMSRGRTLCSHQVIRSPDSQMCDGGDSGRTRTDGNTFDVTIHRAGQTECELSLDQFGGLVHAHSIPRARVHEVMEIVGGDCYATIHG